MVIMQILLKAARTSRLARQIAIPGQIQTMLTHLREQQSTTNQPLRTNPIYLITTTQVKIHQIGHQILQMKITPTHHITMTLVNRLSVPVQTQTMQTHQQAKQGENRFILMKFKSIHEEIQKE